MNKSNNLGHFTSKLNRDKYKHTGKASIEKIKKCFEGEVTKDNFEQIKHPFK